MENIECCFLNLLIGTTNRLAMLAQNIQLMLQDVFAHACKKVAGIGVLGNKSQRLALTTAANQDGWMRSLNGLWRIKQPGEVIVLAVIGLFITCPHLQSNLECLF